MNLDFYMPARIISGRDCVIKNAALFSSFGKKAMIVTGGSSAKKSGALDDCFSALRQNEIEYTVFDGIEPNPTTVSCHKAGAESAAFGADFIIGIGGGSVLDAAKAVALFAADPSLGHLDLFSRAIPCRHLPVVLIGTSAGTGSEVTGVSVLTNPETGRKKSISGADCYADAACCDYKYTMSLPYDQTVSTSLDAFCHAFEAYVASSANDLTDSFAEKAFALLKVSLLSCYSVPLTDKIREDLYLASIYAGLAINNAGTDYPHTVGYYLTENFGIPHGKACAAFEPSLVLRTEKYNPEKLSSALSVLGCDKDTLINCLRKSAGVNIKIEKKDADAIAQRWSAGVKNFDRSPGGFTVRDAAEVLASIHD